MQLFVYIYNQSINQSFIHSFIHSFKQSFSFIENLRVQAVLVEAPLEVMYPDKQPPHTLFDVHDWRFKDAQSGALEQSPVLINYIFI